MRWLCLISLLATPAAAAEETAQAFWDALLACWAVKDGAAVTDQGWQMAQDWTPVCGDCKAATQVWDVGGGLTVLRMRQSAQAEPTCLLSEASRPSVGQVLPALEQIWAPDGLEWIAQDLRRPDQPFAILLSCEADTDTRKVAVVDASGGDLRFTVSGWSRDYAGMCAGDAG